LKITVNDSHFDILGVTRYSTKEEIKKACREQIKKWHPDKFPNEPDKILEALEKSKKINEAFSFLENYQAPAKPYTSFNPSTYEKSKSQTSQKQSSPKSGASRLNIERIRVESSNIHSVGFDVGSKILQVEFLNGSVYQYNNVPKYVYDELMQAASKGKYFNKNIVFSYKYECV
jgi:curved DNA-binding protein CbpA